MEREREKEKDKMNRKERKKNRTGKSKHIQVWRINPSPEKSEPLPHVIQSV